MSHEFNSPLNVILNGFDCILEVDRQCPYGTNFYCINLLIVKIVKIQLKFLFHDCFMVSFFFLRGGTCPLHVPVLRPTSRAGPMHDSGVGKV